MTQTASSKLALATKTFEEKIKYTRRWRGFGILAVAYIATWTFLFFLWYNPWQIEVALGGDWQLPPLEGLAMFFYLVPGIIILPGAFYVVWTNLLRKNRKLQ